MVSVFYYARFLAPMYFATDDGRFGLLSPWASAATVASGVGVIAIGIAAEPLARAFAAAVALP